MASCDALKKMNLPCTVAAGCISDKQSPAKNGQSGSFEKRKTNMAGGNNMSQLVCAVVSRRARAIGEQRQLLLLFCPLRPRRLYALRYCSEDVVAALLCRAWQDAALLPVRMTPRADDIQDKTPALPPPRRRHLGLSHASSCCVFVSPAAPSEISKGKKRKGTALRKVSLPPFAAHGWRDKSPAWAVQISHTEIQQ